LEFADETPHPGVQIRAMGNRAAMTEIRPAGGRDINADIGVVPTTPNPREEITGNGDRESVMTSDESHQ